MTRIKVLFVCLGNICRSPTAEGVFRSKVTSAKFDSKIFVDSAGTGDWHVGRPPDTRAQEFAAQAGYDLSDLVGRQVSPKDFVEFDYIIAMDNENLNNLEQMRPDNYQGYLGLLLNFDQSLPLEEVPDPYTMGEPAFRNAITLIERGCQGLLDSIQKKHFSDLPEG